jgi:hypothetical protein
VAAPLQIENSGIGSGDIAPARAARRQKPQTTTTEQTSLTPTLKGLIDRVVVPILVKGYVERLQNERSVAESGAKMDSLASTAAARKV